MAIPPNERAMDDFMSGAISLRVYQERCRDEAKKMTDAELARALEVARKGSFASAAVRLRGEQTRSGIGPGLIGPGRVMGYNPYSESRVFRPVSGSPQATDLERLQAQAIVGKQLQQSEAKADRFIDSIPSNDGKPWTSKKPSEVITGGLMTTTTSQPLTVTNTSVFVNGGPITVREFSPVEIGPCKISLEDIDATGAEPGSRLTVNKHGCMTWEKPETNRPPWNPGKWQKEKDEAERKSKVMSLLKSALWVVQRIVFAFGVYQVVRSII